MIATGELNDGDWLPPEAELVTSFGVSRPTLREAFRLLEADGLVEIRRGPPGGARVTTPGPERAAGLFGLILTLSGTTLADVYQARMAIEPPAVRRVAEAADPEAVSRLDEVVGELRRAVGDLDAFAESSATFHHELVRLGGNQTLSAVVRLLTEIGTRHLALVLDEHARTSTEHRTDELRAIRSYERLLDLVRAGRADDAEAFWRRHMQAALTYFGSPGAARQVLDVIS
ncbi:FadR family transcriptional regulator [Nocardioides marmoriginsengisoli]|uniref:FadR family transcriptional regulator n=2 Tax=Nocardioides marmoriginsengisoli TaxID=661483 RepID=A0A3N0CDR2_9ACTN|nr:FadR family transcriptional regulator [Nocardioides marmoriginsengisoli]